MSEPETESAAHVQTQSFQFSSVLKKNQEEVDITRRQVSSLCTVFLSRESGTFESRYCACFEASLPKHTEQMDEVHFTVGL